MLTLKIGIEGKSVSDLEDALSEIKRKINDGYTSGFDSNDDGRYSFSVGGEEEEREEELEVEPEEERDEDLEEEPVGKRDEQPEVEPERQAEVEIEKQRQFKPEMERESF